MSNNYCFWFWFFTSRKYTLKVFLRCWDFHSCSWVESLTYLLFYIFQSGFHQALAVQLLIRCFQRFHWKDRLWFSTTSTKSRCRGWCKTKRKIHCLGEKRETAIVLKVRINIFVSKSRDGTVVSLLAFHQCGVGVIWPNATCGLSLLSAPEVFLQIQGHSMGVWLPPPPCKPFPKQTTYNMFGWRIWWVLIPPPFKKSWGSLVFLPPQKPTFPNSNSSRIEDLHENQLRLVSLWLPL